MVADRPRFAAAEAAVRRTSKDPDMAKVASSLRDYRAAFRENPVGSNAEITRALSGKNPRGLRYLPESAHVNKDGELTDRWDQPLTFHQISGTNMEIRSAGPDHVMWTADDEILR
jgi:hypothetical protein